MNLRRAFVPGAIIAMGALVCALFGIPANTTEQAKVLYYQAVCNIEPYWYSPVYNDESVGQMFQDSLADLTGTLQKANANPKQAPKLMLFLLRTDPYDFLSYNSGYVVSTAQDAGLLDAHLHPVADTPEVKPQRSHGDGEADAVRGPICGSFKFLGKAHVFKPM